MRGKRVINSTPWTAEEDRYIREHHALHGPKAAAPHIPGRRALSVRKRAMQLGVREPSDYRMWRTSEIKILQTQYPTNGFKGCLQSLPDRSAESIRAHLRKLGLSCKQRQVFDNTVTDEQIDASLKKAYEMLGNEKPGWIRDVAMQLMVPERKVNARAVVLGLRQQKQLWIWTTQDDLVIQNCKGNIALAAKKLTELGRPRTATAIIHRSYLLKTTNENSDLYTANDLSKLFGVCRSTVLNWAKRKWLTNSDVAKYNATAWKASAVKSFILNHTGAWDIKSIDKLFLIGILTNDL